MPGQGFKPRKKSKRFTPKQLLKEAKTDAKKMLAKAPSGTIVVARGIRFVKTRSGGIKKV